MSDEVKGVLAQAGVPKPKVTPLPKKAKGAAAARLYHDKVVKELEKCNTPRDVIKVQSDTLAECVGIASEIYKEDPNPDNSYALAALRNAHGAAVTQLHKMTDPEELRKGVQDLFMKTFQDTARAMMLEIDKTKRNLAVRYPDDKSTIEDLFNRMINSIEPETQVLYEGLEKNLKKILEIKS